jgi:hypothetical protein
LIYKELLTPKSQIWGQNRAKPQERSDKKGALATKEPKAIGWKYSNFTQKTNPLEDVRREYPLTLYLQQSDVQI